MNEYVLEAVLTGAFEYVNKRRMLGFAQISPVGVTCLASSCRSVTGGANVVDIQAFSHWKTNLRLLRPINTLIVFSR